MARYPTGVYSVQIYPGAYGFRYTCRDDSGKIVYDSPQAFRSRYLARDEIRRRWPQAKISMEVT